MTMQGDRFYVYSGETLETIRTSRHAAESDVRLFKQICRRPAYIRGDDEFPLKPKPKPKRKRKPKWDPRRRRFTRPPS